MTVTQVSIPGQGCWNWLSSLDEGHCGRTALGQN